MGAVTYPDHAVIDFVNENMIPLQVLFDVQPLSTDFNVKWTPTLITLGTDGKEHHRTVGFLSPEELIPSLMLGIAKSYFETDRFDEALKYLERLLTEYPKSDSAAEGIFCVAYHATKVRMIPNLSRRPTSSLQPIIPQASGPKEPILTDSCNLSFV